MSTNFKRFSLAIHGGAGAVPKSYLQENKKEYERILEETIRTGMSLLSKGSKSGEVVCEIVALLEDCDKFNAGKASVLNSKGRVSMDAAFVDGESASYGGVINVEKVKNPVKLAKKLSEFQHHNIISGEGALEFAKEHGLEIMPMSYFLTEYRKLQLAKAKKVDGFCLDHFDDTILTDDSKYGTVGAVAFDCYGNLAAATSTGGITNKKYGRVGDCPILGAGTFADNATVAVSATGRGEDFTKNLVASDLHARVKYAKVNLTTAANEIVNNVIPKNSGGLIAVDKDGNIAMPFNTPVMFRASCNQNGIIDVAIT